MSNVRIGRAVPYVFREEFERFHRVSPFTHEATAESPPAATRVEQYLIPTEVQVVKTSTREINSQVVVKTP